MLYTAVQVGKAPALDTPLQPLSQQLPIKVQSQLSRRDRLILSDGAGDAIVITVRAAIIIKEVVKRILV